MMNYLFDIMNTANTESNNEPKKRTWKRNTSGLKPWKKGECPNPTGRPKALSVWKQISKDLDHEATTKELSKAFIGMLLKGKDIAWKELLERTEGKVADHVKIDIGINLTNLPKDRLLETCQRLGIVAPGEVIEAEIVPPEEPCKSGVNPPENPNLQKM